MERTERTIDEYVAGLPEERRPDIEELLSMLSAIFDGDEVIVYEGRFWGGTDQEIVGFRPILYPRSDGTEVEWFVVGLAMQKNYISLYVSAVDDGQYLSKKRGPGLGKVKVGSSSVSFSALDDVDRDLLEQFLREARDLSPAGG